MMTLYKYDEIARKLLSCYQRRNGRINIRDENELLGRIIRFMAVADWRYDPAKSRGKSPRKIRRMRGIYAIKEYMKKTRTTDFLPLNYPWYQHNSECVNSAKLTFLINNAGLNKKEKELLNGLLDGIDKSIIAEQMGISFDRYRKLYDSAIDKIKRISNVK